MDTEGKAGPRKKRPNYPLEFKQQLAKAACSPGVSVSQLAMEHGINTNMLFKWRRNLRAGLLGVATPEAVLLAVSVIGKPIAPAVQRPALANSVSPAVVSPSRGMIEIEFAHAVIRIDGPADSATLRTVLQSLRP